MDADYSPTQDDFWDEKNEAHELECEEWGQQEPEVARKLAHAKKVLALMEQQPDDHTAEEFKNAREKVVAVPTKSANKLVQHFNKNCQIV